MKYRQRHSCLLLSVTDDGKNRLSQMQKRYENSGEQRNVEGRELECCHLWCAFFLTSNSACKQTLPDECENDTKQC